MKRSNHESRADEKYQSHGDLHDDQDAARAMLFAALTQGAASFADAGAQTRACILEDGDGAEKHAGKKRDRQSEEQYRGIDTDFMDSGEAGRCHRYQHAQRDVGEAQPDHAAKQPQDDALQEQLSRDTAASGAQGGAQGQLLPASFDADQEQVGHVGAGNQQYHADRTHQDPQHFADVSHDVLFQGTEVRPNARVVEEFEAEAGRGRESSHHNGNHAGNVGAGLREGDAGLQSRDSVVAEVAEEDFVAVKLEGQEHGRVFAVQKVKPLREYADDLAGLPVDHDVAPDGRRVRAELVLPITVGKHDGFGRAGQIVLTAEQAAQHRQDAQNRKRAVGDQQGAHLFGFCEAGDADGIASVHADILKRLAL